MSDRRFEKGRFSSSRFAVAAKYLRLASRKRLFAAGAVVALVFAVLFLVDALVGRGATVAGTLSESHALFGKDCSTCHQPLAGATSVKCESCHQKTDADLKVYSFSRHYEYHSGLTDRSAPDRKEVACGSCHREHKGASESLQKVADVKCASCHDVGSFRKHPEFAFAAEKTPDPANLKFPHVLHVREVMTENDLTDAEAACAHCHTPRPDGKTFQPISYAKGCDGCHLGSNAKTEFVPVRAGAGPGVATLGQIRASGGPGTAWADHWSTSEFEESGGEIQKKPLYHADPWVLFNLRKLRSELYPGAELADLLKTSAEVSARDQRLLHEEAIATLNSQIASLRGDPSPAVQRELASLTELLKQIERRIDEPYAPIDESRFAVSAANLAPGADQAAYQRVIDGLTKECQTCHLVEKATIRRVQTDQRTLIRSEFTHRAHVMHARCLDCHGGIPFRAALETEDNPPAEQDRAEIVNIPTIANCRTCHQSNGPPTRCTSCHLFHPDKSHWAKLSR